MAGEAKAPDNRIFQLVMAIITSIVAPLTIYFVTNASKNAPPEPTPIQATVVLPASTVVESTIPVIVVTATPQTTIETTVTATSTITAAFTATTTATSTTTATPTFTTVPPTPTEAGLRNPRGNVPAGSVVLADTFALVIDKEDIKVEGDYLRLTIRVQNTGKEAKALNYTLKSITIKDNTGRTYAPFNGEKGKDCKKQELDKKRSVKVEPQAVFTFQSPEREDANWFCSGDHVGALPLYIGPIHKDAKQVFVQINGLGPFSGFTVQIDR